MTVKRNLSLFLVIACLSFAEKLPSRTTRGPSQNPSEGVHDNWTDWCPPRMPETPAQGLWTADGSRGEEGNQAVTPPNRKRSKSPRDGGDPQRGERRPSPGAAKLPPGSRMGSNDGSNGPSRKSSRERSQSRNREWRYFNGSDQGGHFEEPPPSFANRSNCQGNGDEEVPKDLFEEVRNLRTKVNALNQQITADAAKQRDRIKDQHENYEEWCESEIAAIRQ